jgi:hypothetical protein
MDNEAPKSWSQFRGHPPGGSPLGKQGLIQSPTGVEVQEASSDSGWFDGRQAAFMPLAGGSPSESRVFVNLCCLFDS